MTDPLPELTPTSSKPRGLVLIAGGIVLSLFLAGCSLWGDDGPKPKCPRVATLPDAKTISLYREGRGRDIIDINFEAELANVVGTCEYDVDDDTGEGTLELELKAGFRLERGPANADRKAAFRYFVSITDSANKVVTKNVFPISVTFEGNQSRLLYADEPVLLNIPIRKGILGADYSIIVGFQLTPEQLKENRAKQQRPR